MRIKDLLERDPYREVASVIRITDHDPRKVCAEMDEYVSTEKVRNCLRDILDTLAETRRGATERVCAWVSGFFGSGKSHFLKVLGYLLQNRELRDPDGHAHSSAEFLCCKLGLDSFLPLVTKEFHTRVLFINLLDCDPQSPDRPTFSWLIHRNLLEQEGLSTEFWVAAWEKDLIRLGKWDAFREWVKATYGRSWEEERKLNAEAVLKAALLKLLPKQYRKEDEAGRALQESKRK